MTPFEALYGYKAPQMGYGPHIIQKTEGVRAWLEQHQVITQQLKRLLKEAQDKMKTYADQNRSERAFEEGDLVYLKLKPYKQRNLRKIHLWKLTPKYCGPFSVVKRVGSVAYKLQLPSDSKVHPVFHVSQLKKHVLAHARVAAVLPPLDEQNQFLLIPEGVLDRKMIKKINTAVVQWLVKWAHLPTEEATWENAEEMGKKFPTFQP
ncbi:hypothetical protein ABFS83_01G113100 [Erythranthe nasuta]